MDSLSPSFTYQHHDTEIIDENERNQLMAALSRQGETSDLYSDSENPQDVTDDDGFFARLVPLNPSAQRAFHNLASHRNEDVYKYHAQFLEIDGTESEMHCGSFVLSLGNLPEFAPLGWRIGKGRKNQKNSAVDLLLTPDPHDEAEIAGLHARLSWIKGGGGFFLIADNMRGKPVTLNGEILVNEQRLIPYHNTIGIGQCYYTMKFAIRTPEGEEQFQTELAEFYSVVLSESAPLVLPTPSEHEVRIGNWIVRNGLGKGSYGHVYLVSHSHSGKPAAAKELWRTLYNSRRVNEEVEMNKFLMDIKHDRLATPFDFHHEKSLKIDSTRRMKLLDDSYRPGGADITDRYIFFSPLCTSTFHSLIASKASDDTRMTLFAQIVEGIAFLHSIGIAHRDIKPDNLVVESYDPPLARIIDFGCATKDNSVLYDRPGTVPYLAPEQRPGMYHGRAVDCWACGLVGLDLMKYKRSNLQVDSSMLANIHVWLDDRRQHPITACCRAFLEWNAEDRLTAQASVDGVLSKYLKMGQGAKNITTRPKRNGSPIMRECERRNREPCL